MKKIEKTARKALVFAVGKMLTLIGVALTFACCYGVMPPRDHEPEYWAQPSDAEQTLYGRKAESPVNTVNETPAETLAEQASQNEPSAQ